MAGAYVPDDTLNLSSVTVDVYFELSAKYASSAVNRLRRSDFICARYALFFVFPNFGTAIAARMPMMTTTINSSIRVNPLRSVDMFRSSRRWGENGRGLHSLATDGPGRATYAILFNRLDLVKLPGGGVLREACVSPLRKHFAMLRRRITPVGERMSGETP